MMPTLYRLLLLAFPKHVRRDVGDDMVRMFEDQLREARARNDSVLRLWIAAINDAVVQGSAERLAGGRRDIAALISGIRRWRSWMHAVGQDLSYAARLLIKQPGMTFVAILTLALGIGANTAIFSAVNAVLLRPLPYPDSDRLVMVWEKRIAEGVLNNVVSPADFLDWSRMNGAFENIAALSGMTADLTGAGEPVRLSAAAVSPSFFDVLGVQPVLGRTFRPEEAIIGQHRVVILTHRLWETRFGSDPSIVGRKILSMDSRTRWPASFPRRSSSRMPTSSCGRRSRSRGAPRRRRGRITSSAFTPD